MTVPESEHMRKSGPWRDVLWFGLAALLLVPLVAMQFTAEVRWDAADFAVFAAMLLAVGGAFELVFRLISTRAYRIALGVAIVAVFLLVWADLAVGIYR